MRCTFQKQASGQISMTNTIFLELKSFFQSKKSVCPETFNKFLNGTELYGKSDNPSKITGTQIQAGINEIIKWLYANIKQKDSLLKELTILETNFYKIVPSKGRVVFWNSLKIEGKFLYFSVLIALIKFIFDKWNAKEALDYIGNLISNIQKHILPFMLILIIILFLICTIRCLYNSGTKKDINTSIKCNYYLWEVYTSMFYVAIKIIICDILQNKNNISSLNKDDFTEYCTNIILSYVRSNKTQPQVD